MKQEPLFPLTVTFHEDGEVWVLSDLTDAACNLEWFDSEDAEEHVSVVDSLGRAVRLKIDSLQVVTCSLK